MSIDSSTDQLRVMPKTALLPGTVYKPSSPTKARVLSNVNITPDGDDDWHHLVFEVPSGDYAYIEGQSLGVIAPGQDERGKAHRVRLYSIASPRAGEDGVARTVALSVKRVQYDHPETKERVYGVASHYICNLQPGDEVVVTGPAGKAFVLPEADDVDLLLFATGTGVAPFRAFLQRLYNETSYRGRVLLFYGVRRRADLAYSNESNQDFARFESFDSFRMVTALSRENPAGAKVYVQNRMLEHSDEIWSILERGNFASYICGIKGMEKGIEASFSQIVGDRGADWETLKQKYKREGRWNLEVY